MKAGNYTSNEEERRHQKLMSTQNKCTSTDDLNSSTCIPSSKDGDGNIDDVMIDTHYIFLVHGWLGEAAEMKYVEQSIHHQLHHLKLHQHICDNNEKDNEKSNIINSATRVKVYSSTYNTGKTNDGLVIGGQRLSNEIQDFIKGDIKNTYFHNPTGCRNKYEYHVTLSLLGNSLGGLYSRYSISCLPSILEFELPIPLSASSLSTPSLSTSSKILVYLHFNTFITTVSPHLGLLSTKRRFKAIARMIGKQSGCDLYLTSNRSQQHPNPNYNYYHPHTGMNTSSSTTCTTCYLPCFRKKKTKTDSDYNNCNDIDNSNHNVSDQSHDKNEEQYGVLFQMGTNYETFLKPLSNFHCRILYANSFQNDFQVPTTTAAFLSKQSTYPHYILSSTVKHKSNTSNNKNDKDINDHGSFVVTSCITKRNNYILQQSVNDIRKNILQKKLIKKNLKIKEDIKLKDLIMSNKLDSLGWTKVFIDCRHLNPIKSSIPLICKQKSREVWTDFVNERESIHSTISYSSSRFIGNCKERQQHDAISIISLMKGTYQLSNDDDNNNDRINVIEIDHTDDDDDNNESNNNANKNNVSPYIAEVTSKDLYVYMNKNERILQVPFGHTLVIANSKSTMEKLNSAGRPIVDYITSKLVEQVFKFHLETK